MDPSVEADREKLPALRTDLKVSRQVRSGQVTYIIKDPIKNTFFRFSTEEWAIISLFDGTRTLEQVVEAFNRCSKDAEIDLDTAKGYYESLQQMKLLHRTQKDLNIMLIEKMKELRQSFLLSKKGSIMYKRFPVVDPDRFFNRIIPHIGFFWTKTFLLFSLACMAAAIGIVASRWPEFSNGVNEIFSFKNSSFWGLALLWVTIYLTIAIHEMGHGLTCKYYGGEVHEIGLLLMFFQPCLYANVNDAWLFDKKWKQVIVTIAGGYIEVWVGSLFTFLWAITNPNTAINTLSMQVMAICSASTVLFNFNPLMKLDGYYLLADFLETPNLKDNSFKYLKYLSTVYLFRMPDGGFEAASREKVIYFCYGVASFLWILTLMTGLFAMAKNLLVAHYYDIGLILSFWVAYKLFGSQLKKGGMFLIKWYLAKRAVFSDPKIRRWSACGVVVVVALALVPLRYSVPGHCVLEPSAVQVIRARSDGAIKEFVVHDGEALKADQVVAQMENQVLEFDVKSSRLAVEKLKYKLRQAINSDQSMVIGLQHELAAKELELDKKQDIFNSLSVKAPSGVPDGAVLACDHETRKIASFVRDGDEVCRVLGIKELRAVIDISEHNIGFIREQDRVDFKLGSSPFKTYLGKVKMIRTQGVPDPTNPKAKLYKAEIAIDNPGDLRPGMNGIAKIITERASALRIIGRKLSGFLRLDLFF